jgi:sulfur-oxidizing protein SoxZ
MGDPMKIRAKAEGDVVDVKVLFSHIMESGQRKDDKGNLIPAHFIESVTATCQGRTVLSAQWGPAVSKNPFLNFKFKGGGKGEKLQIKWVDNKGDTRTDEVTIG